MAHPFCPNPACRQSSTAAPRRTPLRCALGHTGRILRRVASCTCSQTLFLPKPSTGTAQTTPAGELCYAEPPPPLTSPLQASQNPNHPIGSLHVPQAPSQAKRHPVSSSGTPVSLSPALRRRGGTPPAPFRRRSSPSSPRPLDQKLAATIRSSALKTQAIRSGSNDPDRRVPLQPGKLHKEPLGFSGFNPRSSCIEN